MGCPNCGAKLKIGDTVETSGKQWLCPACDKWSHKDKWIERSTDPVDGTPLHPLLNPASPHYSMVDGVEAIERMEQMYGTLELMHWAKITAMKYRLRIGKKDSVEGDAKKIATYEAYYEYLGSKL